jgi:hypothetical protein
MRAKHGIGRIRQFAETSPAHGAIECGGLTITYRELADRLDRRQAELAPVVRPGVPFVIDRPRSPEFVVDFLAVFALGGVAVPIDPQLPAGRREILERHLTPGAVDEDGAYVFFTSGSTGTPKPVLGSAAGLAHFLDWQVAEFGIGAPDRVAFLTALSFDVMVRDVLLPLWAGGTLVIPAAASASPRSFSIRPSASCRTCSGSPPRPTRCSTGCPAARPPRSPGRRSSRCRSAAETRRPSGSWRLPCRPGSRCTRSIRPATTTAARTRPCNRGTTSPGAAWRRSGRPSPAPSSDSFHGYSGPQAGEETEPLRSRAGKADSPPGRIGVWCVSEQIC